jgi:hypothetical protein
MFGPSVVFGGRSTGPSDALIVGGGLFGGVGFPMRREQYGRVGIIADVRGARSFPDDYGLHAALYFQHDFFSIWLDRSLSLSAFYRAEHALRYVPGGASSLQYVWTSFVGFQVAGISLALGAGFDVPLASATTEKIGFVFETRLGVELVEIFRLCQAQHGKAPLP